MLVQVSRKKSKKGGYNKSYFIYIPTEICKGMGIKEGMNLECDLKTIPGKILISIK